jgi:hypothetical protein
MPSHARSVAQDSRAVLALDDQRMTTRVEHSDGQWPQFERMRLSPRHVHDVHAWFSDNTTMVSVLSSAIRGDQAA